LDLPGYLQVDLFPSTPTPSEGIGNLVKIPLGVHRGSGKPSLLYSWPDFQVVPNPLLFLKRLDSFIDKKQGEKKMAFNQLFNRVFRAFTGEESTPEIRREATTGKPVGTPIPLPGMVRRTEAKKERSGAITLANVPAGPDPIQNLRQGCSLLADLMKKAEASQLREASEWHVLVYLLTPLGKLGENWLRQHRPSWQNAEALAEAIRAVPPTLMSCKKAKSHCPGRNRSCSCDFDVPDGIYPSPIVHVGIFPKHPKADRIVTGRHDVVEYPTFFEKISGASGAFRRKDSRPAERQVFTPRKALRRDLDEI
jgi:hypothetical protein